MNAAQNMRALTAGAPPSVEILLSRLEHARKYGNGWSARCPAHQDRQASLSVGIGNDGRILVHCFAGCAVGDVLGAAGLTLGDLFARRIRDDSPDGRREASEAAQQARWRAALPVVAFEARIVALAAYDVLRGTLSDIDAARVMVASERIDEACAILAPSEPFRRKVTP